MTVPIILRRLLRPRDGVIWLNNVSASDTYMRLLKALISLDAWGLLYASLHTW